MLTLTEYGHLWKTHFSGIVPAGVIMPDYCEYLNREIYQQDYLDLFGAIVAETFPRVMIGANWYVEITRHPILSTLGLTLLHRPYIYHHTDGNDYLLVDYDFPYKGQLNKGRCIKYIMIGEAARPDTAGTYFYNVNQTSSTPYFDQPCNAFNVNSGDKTIRLLELADNLVVLFDLFPFAVDDYSTIRSKLGNLVLGKFKIILNKLNSLCNIICNDPQLTFLCSTEHAVKIIKKSKKLGVKICGQNIHIDELSYEDWATWANVALTKPTPSLLKQFESWYKLSGNASVLISGNTINSGKRNLIHEYRRIGKVLGWEAQPNEVAIRFALNL
jgi:hypothetical protein